MGRKFGAPLPFWGRGLCPHLSPSPGLRPTSITSGILMYPSSRLATIEMDRKLERGLRLLFGDGAGSSSSKIAWAEAYLHVKYHLDPSSRLATINKGGNLWAPPFFGERERGPHLTKSRGPRTTSIPSVILIHAAMHLAATDVGRKWGAVPLWRGRAGSSSNAMWPGPRPTCEPSFILIRPTVWPQYTNVTDRQTG